MALFGKKKDEAPENPGTTEGMPPPMGVPSDIPTEAVSNLQQQGLSNNQIIQELERQGYNSQQIFDALNTVDSTNAPGGPIGMETAALPEMPAPTESMPSPMPANFDNRKEKIEEMAEAIIDEKWEEFVKSINKIIEWKEKMESNISKIEQQITGLKESYNQLHNSIIGKINEYDKNIVNVGTEVKAMEKVFEKVLPTFTENIGELKRIVKGAKKK